jgi:hypothetical protein
MRSRGSAPPRRGACVGSAEIGARSSSGSSRSRSRSSTKETGHGHQLQRDAPTGDRARVRRYGDDREARRDRRRRVPSRRRARSGGRGRVTEVRLDHVSVTTADLERPIEFHRDVLELPLLDSGDLEGEELETLVGRPGARARWAELRSAAGRCSSCSSTRLRLRGRSSRSRGGPERHTSVWPSRRSIACSRAYATRTLRYRMSSRCPSRGGRTSVASTRGIPTASRSSSSSVRASARGPSRGAGGLAG